MPDDFDRSMDELGNKMEKSVDRAMGRIEKGANVVGKIAQGCTLLLINLFLCGFFSWGVYAAYQGLQAELNGETAQATVTELNELNDPELGRRYTSIVEYEVDGRTYTAEVGEPSIPAEHGVGDALVVRYVRDNPASAEEENRLERWIFPLLLVASMLITALVINFLFIRAWRRGEDVDIDL